MGIGGQAEITGLGTLTLNIGITLPKINNKQPQSKDAYNDQIELNNVALVEKSPVNLISLSAWTDTFPWMKIVIQEDWMYFYEEDHIVAAAQKLGDRQTGNSWHLIATVNKFQNAYTARSLQDWHIILGHTDPRNVIRLSEISKSLSLTKRETKDPHFDCIGCIKGKSTVRQFGNMPSNKSFNIGDLFYSDVWGPARTASIQGYLYYITFTDAASRFTFLFFMKHKNEAVDKFIKLGNIMRTQKGVEIKRIHFDNGKELVNKHLEDHCEKTGTEITTTAPYSSQQNGVAERKNRSLTERGRCMLHGHSNTHDKPYLWSEAIAYACLINNNMPAKINGEWKIPQVLMFGNPLDMKYFQLFGTTCHV
jgi:hypothetical protein